MRRESLSDVQYKVLVLTATGDTTQAAATKLGLSLSTVNYHRDVIYEHIKAKCGDYVPLICLVHFARTVQAQLEQQLPEWEARSKQVRLSNHQLNVADLIASGFRRKDVAQKLGITKNTVHKHLDNIFWEFQIDMTVCCPNVFLTHWVLANNRIKNRYA